MSEMKIFESEEFGQVRTIQDENGNTLFCGNDVASALGYANTRKALIDHCRCVTKRDIPHPQSQNKQIDMIFIPEGDIYRLIIKSKLPTAEKFEKWVFDEVLPSIRQHGGYMQNQDELSAEELLAKAMLVANNVIENQKSLILEMKPKAVFFDTVTESADTFDMGTVAKILGFEGIGRNKLFAILRDKKVLTQNNQPYQKFVNDGWFRVVENKFSKFNGDVCVNSKTLVYQKGVDGIIRILNTTINKK